MPKSLGDIIKRSCLPVKPLPTNADKKLEKFNQLNSSSSKWFDMPTYQKSEQMEADIRTLRLRSVLDPNRHYKSEKPLNSEYIQVGTILEDPTDYYSVMSHKISRKKQTLSVLDSLIKDDECRSYFKAKFLHSQRKAQSGSHKEYQVQRNKLRKPWNRASKTHRI